MMPADRRGAALLVALWLLVAVAGVASLALAGSRTGVRATRNRIELMQAGWAAEACLEVQKLRTASGGAQSAGRSIPDLDSVGLGGSLWCRIRVEDPAERLQVNLASGEALYATLGDSALVELILAVRPLPAVEALAVRHGVDSALASQLKALLTVRGPGLVNLNGAAPEVLRSLPGFDEDAARLLVERRRVRRFASLDEALSVLPRRARERALHRYPELVAQAVAVSGELVSRSEGHVGDSPIVAGVTATVVLAGDRLAVTRRETW
jgi:type II secretory pathway component PulK